MQDKVIYEPRYLRWNKGRRLAAKAPAFDFDTTVDTEPIITFEPAPEEAIDEDAMVEHYLAILRDDYETAWNTPTDAVFGDTFEMFDADEFTANAGFRITTRP